MCNRDQIARSGVVNLNEFLHREVLDSDAATRPPEQDGGIPAFQSGSTNVNLRGFGSDQTFIARKVAAPRALNDQS